MKLALLAPEFIPTWGGVGIYTVNLVKELSRKKGVEIHVITPRFGKHYNKSRIEKQYNVKIHNVSTSADTFFYNYHFQVGVFRDLPSLNKKYKFDIIHATNLVHMPDIWVKLFQSLDVPSVCTIHTTIEGQVSGFLRSNKNFFKMPISEKMSLILFPFISVLQWAYIKKSKHLIAVSQKSAEELARKHNKKIIAIPNGIDTRYYSPTNTKNFPVRTKKKIVTYAGRIIMQKGLQHFVRLMKHIDAYFLIAGRGDVQLLDKLCKEYKIPKTSYKYVGYLNQSQLAGLYKISDVFVLPSYYENFPISLLEAMAMEVPCVATDVGAVSEIIDHDKNGLMVPAGDFERLLNSVTSLLNNNNYAKMLGRNARKKIVDHYSAQRMATSTYNYYQKVLAV